MIWLIMGSAFLFGALLLFGALGLLVEWIAYRMEARERRKIKASVWRLQEKNEDWRERKCQ